MMLFVAHPTKNNRSLFQRQKPKDPKKEKKKPTKPKDFSMGIDDWTDMVSATRSQGEFKNRFSGLDGLHDRKKLTTIKR